MHKVCLNIRSFSFACMTCFIVIRSAATVCIFVVLVSYNYVFRCDILYGGMSRG